jgi:hypothetical protein
MAAGTGVIDDELSPEQDGVSRRQRRPAGDRGHQQHDDRRTYT